MKKVIVISKHCGFHEMMIVIYSICSCSGCGHKEDIIKEKL